MPKYTKKIDSPVDTKNVPDDVLSNIFIRLLAKQLAQMRCVCKSWNTLLSEPKFVKSHLQNSIHNNDEILLFFKKKSSFDSNPGPSTARPSRSPDLELTDLIKKLKFPVDDPKHKKALCYVIGSVNGLICFSYATKEGCLVCIWNPSLSALLTLPPSCLSHDVAFMGFGFDPKNDDYKVVRISSYFGKPNMASQPQALIYSMRKGSWEPISQRIPSQIEQFCGPNEVCVDGCLHWICVTDSEHKPDTIVTFDLGAMTYGEIPLPHRATDSLLEGPHAFGVYGGKLCVMTTNSDFVCEVWMMDDEESWVKRHVFSQFNCFMNPYGFTSRNQFLFQADDSPRFALHDPNVDNTKNFKIKWTEQFDAYKIVEYVDSLVWITPPTHSKLAD